MEYLELGQIVNTTGLAGLVKANVFTDDITRFDKLKSIYVDKKQNGIVQYKIISVRYQKNQAILQLEGINSIEEAEKLKGFYLKIDKKDAVKLPKNSYFISDIMSLDVYTEKGEYLGKVVDIFPTGSNDVYVVKNDLGKQILLPAISQVIKNIDLENKKITAELITGLQFE